MIRIAAVGDIMPGGLLHGRTEPYVSEQVLQYLGDADLRVGTLECAIGDGATLLDEKMRRYGDIIFAPSSDLPRLKELRMDVVSLANNHFFDLRAEQALQTLEQLDALGIRHCGAGRNLAEAARPAVVEVGGKRIAFLAFCDRHNYMGYVPFATEEAPGVNPMGESWTLAQIRQAKAHYDYVVVLPHWGREHTYETTDWCWQMARRMIQAGCCLVLGSHPHRVQPVVNSPGQAVAYSMGNFLFPDRLLAPPLRVTYYPAEPVQLSELPVTENFPAVSELTYKKWPSRARYGMVVKAELNEGSIVHTEYRLTRMDERNHVDFAVAEKSMSCALTWQHFLLKHLPYRYVQALRIRMKRWFRKNRKTV